MYWAVSVVRRPDLIWLMAAFSLLPSTLLIIQFSLVNGLHGLALMVISWLALYLSSQSFVITINSPSTRSPHHQEVMQRSVLGPLLFILTLILSVLLSLIHLMVIIYAVDTQFFYSFTLWIAPTQHTFYTSKTQLILSLSGCLPIFSHSISLKLKFFLLVFLLTTLKSLIPLFSYFLMSAVHHITLLKILALVLILNSQCLIIFPQFQNLVTYQFVTFGG